MSFRGVTLGEDCVFPPVFSVRRKLGEASICEGSSAESFRLFADLVIELAIL